MLKRGRTKLPGHMDTYDAVYIKEDGTEIGMYQHKLNPDWFYNSVMGIVVRDDKKKE